MRLAVAGFTATKKGNETTGSDDAMWPETVGPPVVLARGCCHRFAVADGASGSVCSALWARQLVRAFGRGRLNETEESTAGTARVWGLMARAWRRRAEAQLRAAHGGDLPWYLEQKLEASAEAALLGISITWDWGPVPAWIGCAIGDACVAHVKSKGKWSSFPVSDAAVFGNDPVLLPADPRGGERFGCSPLSSGNLWPGDRLYLMTDALAAWFIGRASGGGRPWEELDGALFGPQPGEWLEAERGSGRLKNDDVTVLRISCGYD